RDETVADLVAHTKLKTPTAVAGFLLDRCLNFESHIHILSEDIRAMATTRIKLQQETLDNRILTLSHSTSRFINKQDSHIDSLLRNLTDKPRKYMAAQTKQLGSFELHLINFSRKHLENAELHQQRLQNRANHLSRK